MSRGTRLSRPPPLYRKTMVIIGDSYVANHRRPTEETWHYRLAEKYQMDYYNYGFNGNALILPRKAKWREPVIERIDEMHEPADYVVVIAGHNDANEIGKPGAVEKFADGLDTLVAKLRTKYPAAKIVFVSPWGVERKGFAEVLGAMRERLPKAGVAFYDAAALSGINPNDKEGGKAALWQGPNDTAHLTAEGHAIMLEKMEPFFNELGVGSL